MPKNITLQVLKTPKTNLLTGKAEAMRPVQGDIINAWLSTVVATKIGNDYILNGGALSHPRWVYVHITDVPNTQAAKAYRLKENEVLTFLNPDSPVPFSEEEHLPRRLFKYRVEKNDIPAAKRQKLLANGEITVTWAQAKPYIKKKIVTLEMNPVMDTEVILTDEDLS